MANLRDIRNRITSVNNTIQITKAMKMVAAAKLRKAQNRMNETRPYRAKLSEVVSRLVSGNEQSNELLRTPETVDRILLIIVGSDRGLCGGFNNNLFKVVESELRGRWSEKLASNSVDLICVGKKANAYFRKRNYSVVEGHPGFFDQLNFPDTSVIMEGARDQFVSGIYDQVHIAYNEFKSVISQNRLVRKVLPVDPVELVKEHSGDDSVSVNDYLYEPDSAAILDRLLPLHLNMELWGAVLESNAAEQGARMAAMDNATENAKELEEDLRLSYNQARQSAITTEISEIVSGAQALED
ncbi:MAG: ATP synthase F1 subunit gamma [Balneolaceae bacterium]